MIPHLKPWHIDFTLRNVKRVDADGSFDPRAQGTEVPTVREVVKLVTASTRPTRRGAPVADPCTQRSRAWRQDKGGHPDEQDRHESEKRHDETAERQGAAAVRRLQPGPVR